MIESNFQLIGKPRIYSISYETNKKFNFTTGIPVHINNDVVINKSSDNNLHEALVTLKIGINMQQELEKVPFQIKLEIEGYFKWDDDLENNSALLENLLKHNAPAVLYSYLRPFITLITFEANMPPLMIPLMNFKD